MSGSGPLVSVVIPSYNAERYLGEAVRSALSQTYAPLEVIVVDDGSAVDQGQVLSGIADPRVRFVRQANGGVANARNHGARLAMGDLFAFLDADDRWLPDKLAVQVDLLQRQAAEVAFCDLFRFTGDKRLDRTYLAALPVPPPDRFFQGLLRRNFVPLSTTVVTRAAFERVEGFCEDRSIWEDWDIWIRLAGHYRFVHAVQPLAEYRVHDSNASGNVDVMVNRSLGTLDRLERTMPEYLQGYEADVRHSRANLYYELGYARLREGSRASGRQALVTAFRLRPLHLPTAKELLRSFLQLPS